MIETDQQIKKIFEEACSIMLPNQLRKFLVCFIIADNYQANVLWEQFQKFFAEDFSKQCKDLALTEIQNLLNAEGYSCKQFGLPEPKHNM